MREDETDLEGLARLHLESGEGALRAAWRRGMATLAAVVASGRPVPLEGMDPPGLFESVRLALARGLIDDLSWMSPTHGALALFELASAIPRGALQRELGRRVLRQMHEGDAETFAALARSIAMGSQRGLSGRIVRARVALALDLPGASSTQVDALALALISRSELSREWLMLPATGSLPSRRLAARLIERAAREATRRAAHGDHTGVRVLLGPPVSDAWDRLLADRESLAWRHVAVARGLLSSTVPELASDISRGLQLGAGPTTWRRAAASLSASIAADRHSAFERCLELLAGPIVERDPGVCVAMIFGLSCADEVEPELAAALLERLLERGGLSAWEAWSDVAAEHRGGESAVDVRARMAPFMGRSDRGEAVLAEAIADELTDGRSLRRAVVAAARALGREPAPSRFVAARAAQQRALELVAEIEAADLATGPGEDRALRALRELDHGLLQRDTLPAILAITSEAGEAPLAPIFVRLTRWLLDRERPIVRHADVANPVARMHRLQALLHLIDADGDNAGGSEGLRERRLQALRVLCGRVGNDVPSRLRRVVCATLARVCDAVVREQHGEISDVVLAVTMEVHADDDLEVLAEASMVPELEIVLRAYVQLLRARDDEPAPRAIDALDTLVRSLPPAGSARVEALRGALMQLARALRALTLSGGMVELRAAQVLPRLQAAVVWLARLAVGARRRLALADPAAMPLCGDAVLALERAVDDAVAAGCGGADDGLRAAIDNALAVMQEELPPAVAHVLGIALRRVHELSATAPNEGPLTLMVDNAAGSWLPASRIVGGFYITGGLGTGGGGSVFSACRVTDRHQPAPQRFALKVPEYNGTVAHTLSEAEFLQLFQQEAAALLTLPRHPNLAQLVTFDAGARPKPILVMELVEGASLERLLEKGDVTWSTALRLLDGITAGVEVMHSVGIAHLDLKPANIIVRSDDPVLVDFGLAGRSLRPGCATVYYGAPEVWTGRDCSPLPADVYALSCLAFELVTGEPLFTAETAIGFVTAHLAHDGLPPLLAELAHVDGMALLVDLLSRGLRADPAARITIGELRAGFSALTRPA